MQIEAFSEEHLDAAAALLAERHRRHREVEPLLPGDVDFRAEVEALWQKDGASGAFTQDGYVLATRLDDGVWGPNAWIELAGHAAREPELVRDLYAHAAGRWVEEGRTSHYAYVPAHEAELVDAWFRLGFGAHQAFGIRELDGARPWPRGIREASAGDVERLLELAPLIADHVAGSPAFSLGPPDWDDDGLRRLIHDDLAAEDATVLMAGDEGALYLRRLADHAPLTGPSESALLAWIAVVPNARGRGLGLALTEAAFAWAAEHGYRTMIADWRVTNLLASRFWPKRGFRTTFLRLHRAIA